MLRPELQKQLLEELKATNLLTPEKYQEYLGILKSNPGKFEQLLESDAAIKAENLAKVKGKVLNIPYKSLEGEEIDVKVLKILPQDLAVNYRMVIFEKEGNELHVGQVDPTNYKASQALEFLARKKNLQVKYFIISPQSFSTAVKSYGSIKEEVGEALGFAEKKFAPKDGETIEEATTLEEVIKSAPVSKIASVILRHAIEGGASDIHIEPQGNKSKIRFRIDGVLHTSIILPIYVHAALVSRVKVISNLKIDETRVPQDGRIRLTIDNRNIDFRVSIIPLVSQEKVVMRILESPEKAPTFESLGFFGIPLEQMEKNLKRPNGLFLVTGPTGSGKSTTLFSALSILNQEGININTLEDPVEYRVMGVNQSQVRSELGFTFATGLRALLRQDPDIIMVGEIRDKETSQLAIHAALTGHFVLSTLHTNDAIGTIPRFMDMGAEPFLLASTLNVIIAQRLIRKICENCKVKDDVPPEIREEIRNDLATIPEKAWYKGTKENKEMIFHRGEGCTQCGGSGYKGRLAIAEILPINHQMREIIAQGFSAKAVEEELKKVNFIDLKRDGWLKALLGLTSIEEVYRVTKSEE